MKTTHINTHVNEKNNFSINMHLYYKILHFNSVNFLTMTSQSDLQSSTNKLPACVILAWHTLWLFITLYISHG